MVDVEKLADEVLEFYAKKIETNYRIGVVIVGPPGSGKSTIANQLRDTINARYAQYMSGHSVPIFSQVSTTGKNFLDNANYLVSDLKEALECQKETLSENEGTIPEVIENHAFKPVKITGHDSITVVGRGGISNAIKISPPTSESDDKCGNMVEVIPMDGFHLTRRCLDNFVDPSTAHKRRGSPSTFDSNNFLQLIRIVSKTMTISPPDFKKQPNILNNISQTTRNDLPTIYVPGFDHSFKDPTPDQYCISSSARILIIEGLYLFHDDENWKEVYPTLERTKAVFPCYIEIDLEAIETRIAKRHLRSGLVDTLEAGREKCRENDLLNAQLVIAKKMEINGVHMLRND
ncbi:ATP-dependent kinase Yfh7p [Monosporozyma servazzii]